MKEKFERKLPKDNTNEKKEGEVREDKFNRDRLFSLKGTEIKYLEMPLDCYAVDYYNETELREMMSLILRGTDYHTAGEILAATSNPGVVFETNVRVDKDKIEEHLNNKGKENKKDMLGLFDSCMTEPSTVYRDSYEIPEDIDKVYNFYPVDKKRYSEIYPEFEDDEVNNIKGYFITEPSDSDPQYASMGFIPLKRKELSE